MGVFGGPNKVKGGIVFSLDGANPASYAGDSVTSLGTDYGYFGGGQSSSYTTIDRIDFSNDTATASAKGPLTTIRDNFQGGATGSTSYGYFGGGYATGAPGSPDTRSSIDRVDYSNDTPTATAKGPLSEGKYYVAAVGTNSYGYFAGGRDPAKTTVDRLDYSSDSTTAAVKGPLSANTYGHAATGNSSYGYIGGIGVLPAGSTTVNRIDYSSDTSTAAVKGPLSVIRFNSGATGNASYGYFGGGGWPSSSLVSSVDRLDYSSDTSTASPKGPLTSTRYSLGATSIASYGYFGGGFLNPSDGISTVDRLDYSSDSTTTVTKGPLSDGRRWVGGVSSKDNALPTTSSSTRSATQTVGTPYGYFIGGYFPAKSTVDRIDYSNDTATAAVKGPLSATKYAAGATGNLSYGYYGGGATPSAVTTVDRIDYGNDTATAAVKGPLNFGGYAFTATGNLSYGYFAGGYGPSNKTLVDRIDYSNDTATATAKGPLAVAARGMSATGNTSYGYFGGGGTPLYTKVERIDYSNDTATASPKGPLAAVVYNSGATGNASYGYWGAFPALTTVSRIDYSSDTPTAATKGPLASAKGYRGATGTTSYGYWGGGSPGDVSTVDRLDFDNDTTTASTKGPLSQARRYLAATGSKINGFPAPYAIYPWYDNSGRGNNANITDARFRATDGGYFTFDGTGDYLTVPSTTDFAFGTGDFTVEYWVKTPATFGTDYGYFAGGQNPYVSSIIQRIDYSNDTPTASARTNLSHPKFTNAGSVSNMSYGYFVGGYGPSNQTGIDRLDYSNDTATATPTGNITNPTQSQASAGTNSYGYIAGGQKSPGWTYISSVERLDYSSDTGTTTKGPLNQAKLGSGGMGNASYGYFAGGVVPGSPNYEISKTDRIDYSNDTPTASPKGDLTINVGSNQSAAGNASYGWVSGGRQISGFVKFSTVNRIDYSSDTSTASPKGPLAATRYQAAATGNTSYGWHGAGKDPSGRSNIYRIDYSNDTPVAVEKGPLIAATYGVGATSSRENALPTSITVSAANIINPDSETGSGYWAHQYDTTFDWNSEYGDGSSLGTNYGYITGGSAPSYYSTTNRIDFASDTGTTPTKGPLSAAKGYHRGMSSTSYGYFGGGYHPSVHPGYSTVDRLDYSSDTDAATPKGQLTQNMVNGGAAGNTSYGYIGGGSLGGTAYSTVNRVDYADDTATALSKGPLSAARTANNATGNLSYGYWGAGYLSWGTFLSVIDRIDYSNDTPTASPKGALTQGREGLAATGNASYGYFCGGYFNPAPSPAVYTTMVDRTDYSSDTTTAVAKGPLTVGRRRIGGATGTTAYGYIGGGETTPGAAVTTVDRIDYSNDTPTASPKGPLSDDTFQQGTVSSRANGFPTTSSSTELYTCALSPVNDGSWHHVVMTRKSGTQQTYYDGVGITTTAGTYTDGTDYSGIDGWYIGKGGGTAFSGNLANITIRKGKGLSNNEVQQNFNALRSRFGV